VCKSVRRRAEDLRVHERVEADRLASCTLSNGTVQDCRVVDLSLTGSAVEIDPAPPIGTEVMIGRMRGCVVRLIQGCVAIRFLEAATGMVSINKRLLGGRPG